MLPLAGLSRTLSDGKYAPETGSPHEFTEEYPLEQGTRARRKRPDDNEGLTGLTTEDPACGNVPAGGRKVVHGSRPRSWTSSRKTDDWHLDERTRRIGRLGVSSARAALEASTRTPSAA